MNYVVIVKTAKDSSEEVHKGLPPDFPVKCEEFALAEDAYAKYPDKKIMTADEYKIYAGAMEMIFEFVKAQKPWWKFW